MYLGGVLIHSEMVDTDRPTPRLLERSSMSVTSGVWTIFGRAIPRAEIEYFCQILLIYIVVIACLVNLAIGKHAELFQSLLGLCLGAILPAPHFKRPHPSDPQPHGL